ncbi:virulence protein MsgA [Erwinia mallotivora]|uniref:Virulence protein MsgA n=1 Tax=Erwinia mallotivora TaxID=69222 RepID=A0A014PUM6_9GAMM|nr:virulence protein MsgA [Erwinia mallotivora]
MLQADDNKTRSPKSEKEKLNRLLEEMFEEADMRLVNEV